TPKARHVGGERDTGRTDDKYPATADQVTSAASSYQHHAEGQRIARKYPLHIGIRSIKPRLDRRQGNVNDGNANQRHEYRDKQDEQDTPASRIFTGRIFSGVCFRCRGMRSEEHTSEL